MSQEVILVEDVPGLGEQGNVVKVADGYARNFLLPRKLATPVTPSTLRQLEKKQAEYEEHRRQLREDAKNLAAKIADITITIPAKAGAEGKIFGSVTAANVIEALEKEGVSLGKHQVVLENPIKELGEFSIPVKLTSEIHATIKLAVVGE